MRKTFIIILSLVMTSLSTMAQYSPQAESPTLPGLEPVFPPTFPDPACGTGRIACRRLLPFDQKHPCHRDHRGRIDRLDFRMLSDRHLEKRNRL